LEVGGIGHLVIWSSGHLVIWSSLVDFEIAKSTNDDETTG
jgi:hypothetical protein